MIEKFNDTETMEKSYENLEKEFTKKCQELSRVKNELRELQEEKNADLVITAGASPRPTETIEEGKATDDEPTKFNTEFRAKAGEFIRKNADAKAYSREISKVLLKDPSLLNCADPFAVAYALVLKDKKPENKEVSVLVQEITAPVEQKPSIPVISKEMVGFVPGKVKPKFSSLDDARSELINRYFS